MKKIIAILLLAVTVQSASAMVSNSPVRGGFHGGGFYHPRTTVVVGGGFYSPYFSPFYYGYPYPYTAAVPYQPTKLDMQIANIKNDYADKIESVKLDKDLTGKERRAQVREFRRERDQAVLEAKRNYYKS
ncbi:hypothetical protein L3C95_29840 [Chitinophaga filiformis]|uniref:hypothetical protein n=1 Tax=Chitinophaga filiformis TaxID=104663 RepID=UPI001F3BCAE7|nr:hypothetical protein [Chitinophaga filiformis]MCF6407135.1 hypothetical protein [Chitinophaga filiformis]